MPAHMWLHNALAWGNLLYPQPTLNQVRVTHVCMMEGAHGMHAQLIHMIYINHLRTLMIYMHNSLTTKWNLDYLNPSGHRQ